MRWPWTRAEEEKREATKETEFVRGRLHQAIKDLDLLLTEIEDRIESGTANGR